MDELTPEEQQLLQGFSGSAAPTSQGLIAPEAEAAPALDTDSGQLTAAELQILGNIQKVQVDELTGEEKPHQTWGVSPEQPANESVLSIVDRAKLSFGDPVGRVDYLKSKYEDATVNSKGELTVKNDGRWFYADPRGYEFTKDPWEKSKEVIADTVLDQAGDLMVAGGAIAGGVAGTALAPGAGTVGGGVTGAALGEYMRSSLGRIVGTYQADPVQQTKDIAFESMLQLAGEKFVPGVKKSVGAIADGVEKLGLKAATEEGAAKMARFYSKFNVGEGPMNTVISYGRQVKNKMKEVAKAAGRNDARYTEKLTSDSIQHVKNLAAKAPKILSKTYQKFQKQIVDSVDDGFKSNIRVTALEGYAKSLDDGIAKMMRGGRELAPEEVMKVMQYAQKAGRLPKGTSVVLKSQAELLKQIKKSGEFGDNALKIANDPEAYSLLKQLHSNLDIAFNSKVTKGKHAAKNMMAFKREMGDILFSLSSKADDSGLNAMRKSFEGYSQIVESNTKKALDNVGQGGLYTKMNSEWSKLSTELKPLSRAHVRSFRGDTGDAPFESLLNKLKTNPGKNQLSKGSLESIEESAKLLGDVESSQAIKNSRVALDVNEAAAAFNPYLTRPGTSAIGIGTYGVLTGNWPLVAATAGVSGALGSPTVAKNAVFATQNMWRGMGALKSMGTEAVDAVAKDPVAASAFLNTMVEGTAVQTSVSQALKGQFMPEAAAAESFVPQSMAEAAAAASQGIYTEDVNAVDTDTLTMENVRANAVGTPLKPEVLGITALAAGSESRLDALSNNLQNLSKDRKGGLSLGLYHMSQRQKTLPAFVKSAGLENRFKGYDPVRRPEEYAKRWAEVGQEIGEVKFAEMQKDFMENGWDEMTKAKKALRARGIKYDSLPDPLKALVFSTTVATGGAGAQAAFKTLNSKLSDTDKAAAISLGRLDRWASRRGAKTHIAGWVGRAIREQKRVHKALTGAPMGKEELSKLEWAIKKVTSHRGVLTNGVKRVLKKEF